MLGTLRSLNDQLFHRLKLTTKLVIMMLTLLVLSLTASIILSYLSQQALVQEMEDSINELSNATAVSVEQLSGEPDPAALQKLMARLGKKGVKEIKLLDVEKKEVLVSTLPQPGGAERKIQSTPTEGGKREYNVSAPLVDGKDVLGYIHVTFTLDDVARTTKASLYKRVAVTVMIFSLGILVSLYLARKYTKPLHDVVRAAKHVAAGDLTKTIEVEGGDEIAELTRNFNEMVEKLRQHRELEERLREAERLSAVGKLASGIAHEIRNPLNFMNLSIDHIRNRLGSGRPDGTAEALALMANIKAEIHRLNTMIENFLTVGKPLTLNKSEVDLGALIQDVVELARQKAVEQGIAIEVADGVPAPRLRADPLQIKTCLMNVVLNAIQAMPAGGRLRITVTPGSGTVDVTISDTGPGISEDDINRIFNPYFTTKKLGIGLGLAITKKVVEEHRGRITVNSRPNEGTDVVISLPVESIEVAV
ncbi:MAG: HAMP domain-containing histidine kinase [Nitrospirae bacterium]|nr:MAG: HAMP domain-containing histidine kinase [Nitrospirota bacterium]